MRSAHYIEKEELINVCRRLKEVKDTENSMMDYSHKQDTSDRANGIPLETPLAKGEVPMSANSINSERADDVHGSTHYKVYPIRWWILALFCFANFLNAYFWISFAAISNYAETYYDVSSAAVNGFSIIYMVGYFPGAVVSIFSR